MMTKRILPCVLVLLPVSEVLAAPTAGDPPEYYCHELKEDRFIFAEPNQEEECKEMGGRFGTFSRKQRKYFCRLTDSGFYLGKSYTRPRAQERCTELGGQLQD